MNQEQKEESPGKKYDLGKPSLELLPPSYWTNSNSSLSVEMASWYFYRREFPNPLSFDPVKVLEYGRNKYTAHNWVKGMKWGRLVGAFHRHVNKFDEESRLWIQRDLTEIDPESGLVHGEHAECCRLFLEEYYRSFLLNRTQGENDCAWNQK